ncbi:MAG: Rne/Rng family ribonuclease [Verrucomicrobia bacterium]|nr:Rne/Rng family ribonuclease [Verrucomicrobiota bacterium]MBV9657002.1 Rne/Rng family ribonuclease [Verrucomicrobiota bacterium]
MIEKVKRILGIGRKKPSNLLVINVEKLERRVALLENGVLEEYSVERVSDRNIVGGIFKGRVRNIEPGLKAMFVDIGYEKNAFLHFWDALPAALDSGVEQIDRGNGNGNRPPQLPPVADRTDEDIDAEFGEGDEEGGEPRPAEQQQQQRRRPPPGPPKKKLTSKDIPSIYPVGSEVLVQVTKGPIGTKGPRVTTNISLAGRYLVLMPYSDQSGISRKIEDPKERDRLRKILRKLDVPPGMGVIMRTVGEEQRARFFVRDLSLLLEQWRAIEAGMREKPAPAALFQEPDLIDRTVRDFLTDEVDRVVCDDLHAVEHMKELVGQISSRSRSRIEFHNEPIDVFEKHGVQRQIDDAFHRQVWLRCGGYIVIDETEALIAIDVNTGRNKGSKDMDKTIFQTNLEAADEIARQLRLRNIGGLIIADFIDMKPHKDRAQVFERMKDRLKRDKSKTHVLPISQLGLMEMTRQRAAESLSSSVFTPCPYCHGRGHVKSAMSMSVELQRALNATMRRYRDSVHEMRVIVHPEVLNRLRTEDEELLIDLERKYEGRLTFRADPTYHQEKFIITDANTGAELKA